jgi:uncharacterized protein (UPF0332 family)
VTAAAEIRALVRAGEEDERIARQALTRREYRQAVSRCYYAAFYYVTAVLKTRDLSYKRHAGTIAAFNREFVHAGLFPAEDYAAVKNAFDLRHEADYRLIEHGAAVVQETLDAVELFGGRVRDVLGEYLGES